MISMHNAFVEQSMGTVQNDERANLSHLDYTKKHVYRLVFTL